MSWPITCYSNTVWLRPFLCQTFMLTFSKRFIPFLCRQHYFFCIFIWRKLQSLSTFSKLFQCCTWNNHQLYIIYCMAEEMDWCSLILVWPNDDSTKDPNQLHQQGLVRPHRARLMWTHCKAFDSLQVINAEYIIWEDFFYYSTETLFNSGKTRIVVVITTLWHSQKTLVSLPLYLRTRQMCLQSYDGAAAPRTMTVWHIKALTAIRL